MQTFNKFFVFFTSFIILASCVSPSSRQPSSIGGDTTLSGTRVNPVQYELAPKWKVKLHDGTYNKWVEGKLKLTSYELGSTQGFTDFQARIEEIRSRNEAAGKSDKKGKGFLSKGPVAALDEISKLLNLIRSNQLQGRDLNDAYHHVAELTSSFNYSFQYPIPRKIFVLAAPFKILSEFYNPPAIGEPAATAIDLTSYDQADLSAVDPVESSFWKNPGSIASKNMYVGFGRSQIPDFSKPCKFDEAKSSFGVHPGFTIKCNGQKWKIKFGNETHTEPFTSRLAWALGFNAIPVDYAPYIWLDYDRSAIRDFNSHKELATYLTGIGFNIVKFNMAMYYDPFDLLLAGAILKDGTRINGPTLKAKLLKNQALKAEQDDNNYNEDFEKQIQYLVAKEASVETVVADNEKSVGPWSWNDLDHPDRRAFRAFGMFTAFLNLFDARTDNNKIRFVTEPDGRKNLKHYVSDLGSGFGGGSNLLNQFNGEPNRLPWQILKVTREDAPTASPLDAASVGKKNGKRAKFVDYYEFLEYHVIQNNSAFNNMQVDDARWMLRKLGQVSEAQMQDALIAAGWSAAEVALIREKLASRRDNMIRELGMQNVIPLWRPQGVNRKMNYDPQTEKAFTVSFAPSVAAKVDNKKVINGMVTGY